MLHYHKNQSCVETGIGNALSTTIAYFCVILYVKMTSFHVTLETAN